MRKNLRKTRSIILLMLCLMVTLVSCKDEDNGSSYNPSIPVEITKLDPEEGGVGTQCLIYGKNFGKDLSQIEVTFNGNKAPIVSTTGDCIYCLVPVRAGSGPVKVTVGKGEKTQECTAEKEFKYEFVTKVGTLAGWMDKDYNSEIKDGTLDEAGFSDPYWIEIDKKTGDLIILEDRLSVRRIKLKEGIVETLFNLPQTIARPRQMSFSSSCDTLFLNNDQDQDNGIAVAIALRSEDFRKVYPMIEGRSSTGGSCHPIHMEYFFNQWNNGDFFQWDFETEAKKILDATGNTTLFTVVGGLVGNLQFAPNGEFAYIAIEDKHMIYKCDYDFETRRIKNVNPLCGELGKDGWTDGFGTQTRFRRPHQGCFDEENNFYVCDEENHCIRKITPEGYVTTFAGRGEWGFADGELRKEAMFNRPHGIAYDKVNKIFYVADKNNRRIRTIREE